MRTTNLLSIFDFYSTNIYESDSFNIDMISVSAKNILHLNMQDHEITTLIALIRNIKRGFEDLNYYFWNDYYMGYSIPKIAKEFDILKLSESSILNIELKYRNNMEKLEDIDVDNIRKQLIRNKYYLSSVKSEQILFTFVLYANGENFVVYKLDENEELELCNLEVVVEMMKKVSEENYQCDLDLLFSAQKHLISPFNETNLFLKDAYFLTQEQEDRKKEILQLIERDEKIISLTGPAGSGKTLLLYDIVKELIKKNSKVRIFHCGYENEGIKELFLQQGWIVNSIVRLKNPESIDQDVIFIDESQRLFPKQLDILMELTEKYGKICVFFHDVTQRLNHKQDPGKVVSRINSYAKKELKLNGKIRQNPALSNFIQRIFNINIPKNNRYNFNFISLTYFNEVDDICSYLDVLTQNGWKYIYMTPSMYDENFFGLQKTYKYGVNSHNVIGQEFDDVVVVMGEKFGYDCSGNLYYYPDSYFPAKETLFQAVTRTKNRLKIIVKGNVRLFEQLSDLLW